MKSKQNQGLWRKISIFLIVMLAVLTIMMGGMPIFAATSGNLNYIDENYNLIEEYSQLLGEETNRYAALDQSSDKAVSKLVSNRVNEYRKQFLDLQSHEDVGERLLTAEIRLVHAQGVAVGRLSWIYGTGISRLASNEGRASVERCYGELCGKVAAAKEPEVLAAQADYMCTELNRCVYGELMSALAREGDSLECSALIAGALDKAQQIQSPDLGGSGFAVLLEELSAELELQRARDVLAEQAKSIFKVIRAGESFSENEYAALFIYKLKDAKTLSEMNSALEGMLAELVAPAVSGKYADLYAALLRERVSAAVLAANGNEEAVRVEELFLNYAIESSRAEYKDKIFRLTFVAEDREYAAIEAEFNREGGRIDGCEGVETLERELGRAIYALQACDIWREFAEKLNVILGPYDKAESAQRGDALYRTALEAVLGAEGNVSATCEGAVADLKTKLDALTCEARAERYLLDHAAVLSAPLSQITVNNELALRSAISDYISLGDEVARMLRSQIKNIVEKYNSVLAQKIRDMRPEDVLYSDYCEMLCSKIKSISIEKIDEYYNKCEFVLAQAKSLTAVLEYYRGITASEQYRGYGQAQKQELEGVCTRVSQALCVVEFDISALVTAEKKARFEIDSANICITVEQASRGSSNIQVQSAVLDAKADIRKAIDKNEMLAVAEKAIFKINRILTGEAVGTRCDEIKYAITKTSFLTSDEKTAYLTKLDELKESGTRDALSAENITVLKFVWNNFCSSLQSIRSESEEIELERAKKEYTSLLDSQAAKTREHLKGLVHLGADIIDDYYNKITSLKAAFLAECASASDSDRVAQLYKNCLSQLESIGISAENKNLDIYKVSVAELLTAMLNCKTNYSAENYNKIKDVIETSAAELKVAASISECNSLIENTKKQISQIADLLVEAKAEYTEKLNKFLAACIADEKAYAEEGLIKLKELHAAALLGAEGFKSVTQTEALKKYMDEALASMRAVNKKLLYSTPAASDLSGATTYPADHDFSLEYWGSISSEGGLSFDGELNIFGVPSGDGYSEIQSLIRRAAKRGTLTSAGTIDASTLKLLKKCVLPLGFDITLSNATESVGLYSVELLLPSVIADESILGVVFVDENGNVKYYNVEKANNLISFEVEHFSRYYIVAESTTNLMPLIIFLAVVLVFEMLVLAAVLVLYYLKKRKEKDMLPMLSAAFFTGPAFGGGVLKIEPKNGTLLAVLMSVAALAMGCAIVAVVRMNAGSKEKSKKNDRVSKKERPALSPAEEVKLLEARLSYIEDPGDSDPKISDPEISRDTVLCTVGADGGEAEIILPDTTVPLVDYEGEVPQEDEAFRNRVEINLDVIAKKFESGELVTPELLKQRHLIGKKTDYVKVLARGTLTKPLVVEAHDFSTAAEEMLRAVGGEAIRIK